MTRAVTADEVGRARLVRSSDPVLRVARRLARLRLSRGTALLSAAVMLLLAVTGDVLTPAAATFTLFYVVPLGVVAWYVGLRPAYAVGLAAVLAHTGATVMDFPKATLPFLVWNACADLGLYVIFARLITALRRRINLEMGAKEDALGQLRHAERLATLGKLASGIAHEVGTPLNVISGRAELIASGTLSSDGVTASAGVIVKQADRVAAIIRQLLDFARRGGARVERIDLTSLVEHTALLLGPMAEKARVHITLDGARVEANVNPSEVQQVVMNLLTNAIHAMPSGGSIAVSVDVETALNRQQGSATEQACAVIRVQDHGEGIAPDVLPKIFDPFFTTRDVGVGTGLGLSVVYGIVHDHGGWLEVETAAAKGTTVSVYLPREPTH